MLQKHSKHLQCCHLQFSPFFFSMSFLDAKKWTFDARTHTQANSWIEWCIALSFVWWKKNHIYKHVLEIAVYLTFYLFSLSLFLLLLPHHQLVSIFVFISRKTVLKWLYQKENIIYIMPMYTLSFVRPIHFLFLSFRYVSFLFVMGSFEKFSH